MPVGILAKKAPRINPLLLATPCQNLSHIHPVGLCNAFYYRNGKGD